MNQISSKLLHVICKTICVALLSFYSVVAIGDEGIFDNRLDLDDANFSSVSFSSSTTGHQFQVADDFVLGAGSQWNLDAVRCTGILFDNGQFLPSIGATIEFDVLILADNGGKPVGTPLDPVPGTAIAWRRAMATGTDTGVFTNGANFEISFDPITLDGGTVYWLVIAPIGDFTFQEVLNPNGSGWAWTGRSGFGNAWQGGTDFQDNWIDQSRQQDFTLYGQPVSIRSPSYTLIDLGDLPGGDDHSSANGINNNGQVVGGSMGTTGIHAFVWDSVNGMQDLGDLPGGDDFSSAIGTNDNGQVVGIASTDEGERAFLWDSVNGMQDLGDLPDGDGSLAAGINESAQVVGCSSAGVFAFLWDNVNGMQDLGGLPGGDDTAAASAINNLGEITGNSYNGTNSHAFLWDSVNGMQDLGSFSGGNDESVGSDINDSGSVVGGSSTADGNRAFLWDSLNGMQNLGDLPGGRENSSAFGINNKGQVVGISRTAARLSPFLWDNINGMQDLNHLLDDSGCGWNLSYAYAINDSGQIVGRGINPEGFGHGFLLTPIVVADPVVSPDSLLITRGFHVSGGVAELAVSDLLDLSLRRRTTSIQSITEFEVKSTSPTATPATFEFTLKGSVFARGNVVQTIELFDYVAAAWELVDTRDAARTPAPDLVVTVAATGDLSRFVEAGTMCIEARIRYQSDNNRQNFASNTDQTIWTIGQ